jgi:hypothetical protein
LRLTKPAGAVLDHELDHPARHALDLHPRHGPPGAEVREVYTVRVETHAARTREALAHEDEPEPQGHRIEQEQPHGHGWPLAPLRLAGLPQEGATRDVPDRKRAADREDREPLRHVALRRARGGRQNYGFELSHRRGSVYYLGATGVAILSNRLSWSRCTYAQSCVRNEGSYVLPLLRVGILPHEFAEEILRVRSATTSTRGRSTGSKRAARHSILLDDRAPLESYDDLSRGCAMCVAANTIPAANARIAVST